MHCIAHAGLHAAASSDESMAEHDTGVEGNGPSVILQPQRRAGAPLAATFLGTVNSIHT